MNPKDIKETNKNPTNVDDLLKVILKDADERRSNAAYGGSHHDGGASAIEAQVKFYNYGRTGQIPPEWDQYMKKLDPEYQEFLRLQKKFGK